MPTPPNNPAKPIVEACQDDIHKPESIVTQSFKPAAAVTPLIATLTDDDWRKQVLTDAEKATTNAALELKDDTFAGFNLLKTVTDTLFKVVNIRDVKIELASAAGVEKPEEEEAGGDEGTKPHKAETSQPKKRKSLAKRFPPKAEAGVKISGVANLLGLKSAEVALEFSMSNKKEKNALIKVKAGDGEGNEISEILGGSLPKAVTDVLSVLDKAQLFNPAFAFSTSNVVDTDEPFDVGISEGFNFYGKLKLSEFRPGSETPEPEKNGLAKILGFVSDAFKIEEITARLCIKKRELGGLDFELDTIIEQDLEFFSGEHIKIVFKGVQISIGVEGTPPEPKATLSASVEVSISYLGADQLLMTGMISLEPESITPSFTMQAMNEPWHPFGFSQLSIKAMAIEMGATYLKPWIDNFGFKAEEVQIGKVTGSMLLKLDTNDYDNFGFQVKTDEITFIEIVSAFSPPVFVAYQAVPGSVKEPLETVINCQVKDMELSIAPAPITIGELFFDQEGIAAKGEMHLWGWVAKMDAKISANEIDVTAEMDPFELNVSKVEVLKVEGAENDKKPLFKLYLGISDKAPEFLMTIAVTFLGVRNEVRAEANTDGLKFKLEQKSDIGGFLLRSSLDSAKFYGEGNFDFKLNEKISLGILGELKLNTKVDFNLITRVDSKFFLSLKGNIPVAGKQAGISFEIKEPVPDLADLSKKLIAYLKDNAVEIFKSVFKTLGEWADAVKSGAVIFGGSVADVAKNGYKLGDNAVGQVIDVAKKVGETPAQIASGLKTSYGWSADKVAVALKAANYGADLVATGIKTAFDLSKLQLAVAMKSANYPVDQVTKGLKSAYSFTNTQIAQTLKDVGYPAHEVAQVLKNVFSLDNVAIAKALKGANYAEEKVRDALDYGLKISESGISAAMGAAGYAKKVISSVLETINPFNW